jgi:hypothetical protein
MARDPKTGRFIIPAGQKIDSPAPAPHPVMAGPCPRACPEDCAGHLPPDEWRKLQQKVEEVVAAALVAAGAPLAASATPPATLMARSRNVARTVGIQPADTMLPQQPLDGRLALLTCFCRRRRDGPELEKPWRRQVVGELLHLRVVAPELLADAVAQPALFLFSSSVRRDHERNSDRQHGADGTRADRCGHRRPA